MKNNLFRIVSFALSFSIVLSLTGCKIVYKYDEKEISKIYYDEVTVDDENGMSNGNLSADNVGNGGENTTNGNVNNGNGNINTNVNTNTGVGNNNNNTGTGNNNNTVNNNAGNNNTATGNNTNGNSNNNNNNNTGNGNTSGNSQNASNNQKEFKEKKLSGSLKIQVFINEAQNPSDAWTTVADRFEDATGINVTLIMGSQVNTQYSARWLAGEAPADIVWINGNGLPDEQMAKSGVFYDLTDTINNGNIYGSSAKIKDNINLNVIEKENGKIFRAPLMTSVQGLWYNKNVIKTAPVNYEQFKSVSKQQKSGLTYPGQYADYSTWGLFMPAVAAYGQDFFNQVASGKPSAFKDSRFKAVMKKYKDYCDSGLVLTGSSSADHMTSQHNWLDGKCGFITNGLWLESEMHDYIPSNFHMAFMASPFIEKNQKPTLVCTSANLAVASKAKNLENALAFIRFVYKDDIQLAFMGKYSYASALKTVDFSKADMSKIARETLNYIYSNQVNLVYKGVRWNDLINNEFKNVINDMTNGSLSVDKACEKLYNTAKKSS